MKKIEADPDINFDTRVRFPKAPPGINEFIDCSRYKQVDPEEERGSRLEEKVDLDEFDEIELEDEFDDFDELEEVKQDTLQK